MMTTKLILPLFFLLTLIFSACAPIADSSTSIAPSSAPATQTASELPTISPITTDDEIEFVSNSDIRFLPAKIDLASATQIDIPLPGKPLWVAAIPQHGGSTWAVAFEDGSLDAYRINSSDYTQTAISPEKLPPGMPLTIYSRDGELFALTAPSVEASLLTLPVLLDPNSPEIAYIAMDGDLVIWSDGQETHLPVNALPDTRILADENGKLLLLSNPTDRYTHNVLGDNIEAAGITLVETNPEPRILGTISIPEPDVIEGIYPIWADLDNDGEREIIVTLSNAQDGARIVAFREDGSLLAEGPAIGTGFRWRHQLVAAPFGNSGENLLAVVRTPHIGGVVEFYRLIGDKLEIVNTVNGISTHSIGSRVLFTAHAGDFDNNGQVELLAPDQSHTRLGIIDVDGSPITWLDLGAELVTNLAAVTFDGNDQLAIAGGLSNNSLRIWLP
jgi:hypothetical protein